MGFYKYVRESWRNPSEKLKQIRRARLTQWRSEPATVKIERPTRLDRARSVGYRAKKGILMIRQRVIRGGRRRPRIKGGRRPKHNRQKKVVGKNYRSVAEERVQKKYPNCEVLNSYEIGKDGRHYWFEVILVDKSSPNVIGDPLLAGIASQTRRVHRGITTAGRRSRGLLKKGRGVEKARPSVRANKRRLK